MATSTAKPPAKQKKRGPKVVQMEANSPPEEAKTPFDGGDTPPIEAPPRTEPARSNPKPFPIPPKPSLKGGYCEEAVGMAYWRGIPDDFAHRLTVYVLREHPVLNRLVECTKDDIELMRQHKKRYPIKYIDLPAEKFSEDTAGEFLNRYGSGKYKVYVNDVGIKGAKETDLQSRNLCKFIVKVYDSDYPPILDPSRPDKGLGILDWTHPDNQSYVTELRNRGIFPPGERGEDVAESSVVTTLANKVGELSDRVGIHEQDRLVERIVEKVGGGQQSRAGELVDVIRAVKEMNPAPAAPVAPPKDPLEIATALFKVMNESKVENPAVDLYRTQLTAALDELKEYRKMLMTPVAPAAPKTFLEQLTEFKAIKELLGGSNGAAEAVVHAGKTTALDVFQTGLTKFLESPLAEGAGQFLAAKAQQIFNGNQQPQMNPSGNGQTQVQPSQMTFQQFLGQVVNPALLRAYGSGQTGETFAAWLYDGYPDRLKELQNFKVAGLTGAPAIVLGYKNTPHMWPALSSQGEAAFRIFVDQFCAWKPEEEEDPTIIDAETADEPEGEEGPERI